MFSEFRICTSISLIWHFTKLSNRHHKWNFLKQKSSFIQLWDFLTFCKCPSPPTFSTKTLISDFLSPTSHVKWFKTKTYELFQHLPALSSLLCCSYQDSSYSCPQVTLSLSFHFSFLPPSLSPSTAPPLRQSHIVQSASNSLGSWSWLWSPELPYFTSHILRWAPQCPTCHDISFVDF